MGLLGGGKSPDLGFPAFSSLVWTSHDEARRIPEPPRATWVTFAPCDFFPLFKNMRQKITDGPTLLVAVPPSRLQALPRRLG